MRVVFPLGGTDLGRSGIGTYVKEVLPRLGHALRETGGSLVAMGHPEELAAYEPQLNGCERLPVHDLHQSAGLSAGWHWLRVGTVARRHQADVVLLPAANRRIARAGKVPTVAVVHDLAQLHIPGKYDRLRMAYFRHLVVPSWRGADELVAVSHATARDLRGALPASCPPIRVVPNGVDHQRFVPLQSDHPLVQRAREHFELHKPYLLYASRLEHPGKNHVRLVRAFAKSSLRESHVLALAGKDWGAEALLRRVIAELDVSESVRLLGFVPDALLPPLVAAAEAVVMVGLREGFGLPALEALAAGRPVCASSTGALPEVVGTLGLTCDPTDEAAIKEALERVASDDALKAAAAKNGPSWAAEHSWERTAQGLLEACRAARGEPSEPTTTA